MTTDTYKRIVLSQFDAALIMLEECVHACPATMWTRKVGKYAFWHVAYHALYCTDLYTARSVHTWKTNPKFHPGGKADVEGEYPTRMITKREVLAYTAHCRALVRASIRRETAATLRGKSGFEWLAFTRAEVHLYSMRHVQHHTGQLSAFLRRAKVSVHWCKAGKA